MLPNSLTYLLTYMVTYLLIDLRPYLLAYLPTCSPAYVLRYLNLRGCERISDLGVEVVAVSCSRLRSLDIGKCDVTDLGLRAVGRHCPALRKLSLRGCELVTDQGLQLIAYCCRGLQHLNIQVEILLNMFDHLTKFTTCTPRWYGVKLLGPFLRHPPPPQRDVGAWFTLHIRTKLSVQTVNNTSMHCQVGRNT
jgi:hypothetical protein